MSFLVDVDSDSWLKEHDACEKLYQEISEQLSARSREVNKNTQNYARLSAAIRLRLKQLSSEVEQLKKKLDVASSMRSITSEEAERRSRQVEVLKSKEVHLSQWFQDRHGNTGNVVPDTRSRLFRGSGNIGEGSSRTIDSDDEPLDTRVQPVSELRSQMKRIEQEQDTGLDTLAQIISRQKELAQTIGGEVDLQNDIIDDLAVQMDRTDSNLIRETRHVAIIDRKDGTCGYWVTIILLFVAIIVVWLV